jgi:hypothetical protein
VNIRWYVGLNSETLKQPLTGVLVGVDVVEVVGLLGELYFGMAVAELLHHEGVVLPHNLPDQVSWNRRHFPSPKTQYNSRVRLQLNATETEKKGNKNGHPQCQTTSGTLSNNYNSSRQGYYRPLHAAER